MEPDYLRFPWIGDLARMRSDLGFSPRWSAAQAVQRYVQGLRMQRYQPPTAAQPYAADQLELSLAQRRRAAQPRAGIDIS
jgi:hypothetical protein